MGRREEKEGRRELKLTDELRFFLVCQDITHFTLNPSPKDISGPVEENPEYSLIVSANNLSVDVENELLIVHKVSLSFFPSLLLPSSLPSLLLDSKNLN